VYKPHSDTHGTPTNDDDSEEISGSELANKESGWQVEQKVPGK